MCLLCGTNWIQVNFRLYVVKRRAVKVSVIGTLRCELECCAVGIQNNLFPIWDSTPYKRQSPSPLPWPPGMLMSCNGIKCYKSPVNRL